MLVPRLPSCPPLPLQSLLLSCKVKKSLATLTALHHFHNDSPNPLECVLKLPVPIDWSVSSLRIIKDDGTVLKAMVKDKDEASEQYSDSISSGMSAFMGNVNGDKEIELSLGNIAPGTGVRTELGLVFPLKCTGSSWLVILPEWLQPKWESLNAVTAVQFEALPLESRKKVLGFTMEIEQSTPILSLTSSSHNLDIIYLEDRLKANIALGTALAANKGNLCVEFHTSENFQPNLQTQFDSVSGEYMGMLSFIPPLLLTDQSSSSPDPLGEYILIIDRSGSMYGNRIEMAKEAAILFLKSLPPTSKFNIISFGSQNSWMFTESRLCEAEAVEFAVREISQFAADFGGTEILNTLKGIYGRPSDPAYPRSLYLLTDGGDSNHNELVKYVEGYSKATRVYSFGIGTDRNSMDGWLITEIAKVAKGTFVFIDNPSTIGKSVVSVLKQAMVPAIANIAVEWPVQQYEQHPANSLLQDCFLGELFTVFVNFGKEPPALGNVRVKAIKTDNKADIEMDVELTSAFEPGDSIHKLWAKWAIKGLDLKHRQEGNAQVLSRIKELSKQYGVPSGHTSYICVSESEEPIEGKLTSVEIQTGPKLPMVQNVPMYPPAPWQGPSYFQVPSRPPMMPQYQAMPSSYPVPSMPQYQAMPSMMPRYMPPPMMQQYMQPPMMQPGIGGPPSMMKFGMPPGMGGMPPMTKPGMPLDMGGMPPMGRMPCMRAMPGMAAMPCSAPPPSVGSPFPMMAQSGPQGQASPKFDLLEDFGSFGCSIQTAMPAPPKQPFSAPPVPSPSFLSSSSFMTIITKQAASGIWPASAFPELHSSCPSALTEDQWVTICVVVLLKTKFKDRADEAELILRKAIRALGAAGVTMGNYEEAASKALNL